MQKSTCKEAKIGHKIRRFTLFAMQGLQILTGYDKKAGSV